MNRAELFTRLLIVAPLVALVVLFAVRGGLAENTEGAEAPGKLERSAPAAQPETQPAGPGEASAPQSPGGSAALNAQRIASITIFVLAVFVGFEIITKVPPTLHTPLMSGSNAISGITLVGALLVAGGEAAAPGSGGGVPMVMGTIAVVLATINVVGGFLVTHRMLGMFRVKR